MAEEKETPAELSVEEQQKQLETYIRGQFETYFNEKKSELQGNTRQQKSQEEIHREQVGELISPFIDPKLNEAQLVAADARDYTDFYLGNPDAFEYKPQVETLFKKMKDAGRATTREDILKYIQGDELKKNPDEFVKKFTEKKKAQLDKINGAADFGAFSMTKAKSDPVFSPEHFEKLTAEEQEKHLEGITF